MNPTIMRTTTSFLTLAALTAALLVPVAPAVAGDCFQDPIYTHDWTGTVTTGARVRDVACMEGSVVRTTIPVGEKVAVTGETDGWWRVRTADGTEGWVGQWLIAASQTPYVVQPTNPAAKAAPSRLRGRILLQVEQHGEAWYVDPLTGSRYYMKDGATAYQMMRSFGLGISEKDYATLAGGNAAMFARLAGRIVLRVEAHGEAYYLHPDGGMYYLRDGAAAYDVMREKSLGITDGDLSMITEDDLVIK